MQLNSGFQTFYSTKAKDMDLSMQLEEELETVKFGMAMHAHGKTTNNS